MLKTKEARSAWGLYLDRAVLAVCVFLLFLVCVAYFLAACSVHISSSSSFSFACVSST